MVLPPLTFFFFFSFTPQVGKAQGPRTPWGGDIRGTGVDGSGLPGAYFTKNDTLEDRKHLVGKIHDVAYVPGKKASLLSDTNSSPVPSVPDLPLSK